MEKKYDANVKYCNNCGNVGHTYKKCLHPILSYGIIVYRKDPENVSEYQILMIERKNSISYIEFLRGKYQNIYNIDYIRLLLSRFSNDEKQEILLYPFDELWKKLWIHTDTINHRIKMEYEKSKKMFESLQRGIIIKNNSITLRQLINEINTSYLYNEWEIPKGRRKQYENNRDCAIREFNEETNISPDHYKLINNIIPITEEYKGINNVNYKHVYYLGEMIKDHKLEIDMDNREQYTEIKSIRWLKVSELSMFIRDHDKLKQTIIERIFSFLKNKRGVYIH